MAAGGSVYGRAMHHGPFWLSRYDRSVALDRGVDTMQRVSTCHVSDFRFQTWAVVGGYLLCSGWRLMTEG